MRTKMMLRVYGFPEWEIQLIARDLRSKNWFQKAMARNQIKTARRLVRAAYAAAKEVRV